VLRSTYRAIACQQSKKHNHWFAVREIHDLEKNLHHKQGGLSRSRENLSWLSRSRRDLSPSRRGFHDHAMIYLDHGRFDLDINKSK